VLIAPVVEKATEKQCPEEVEEMHVMEGGEGEAEVVVEAEGEEGGGEGRGKGQE